MSQGDGGAPKPGPIAKIPAPPRAAGTTPPTTHPAPESGSTPPPLPKAARTTATADPAEEELDWGDPTPTAPEDAGVTPPPTASSASQKPPPAPRKTPPPLPA